MHVCGLSREFLSGYCKSPLFTLLFWMRRKIDPVTLHHGIHVLISRFSGSTTLGCQKKLLPVKYFENVIARFSTYILRTYKPRVRVKPTYYNLDVLAWFSGFLQRNQLYIYTAIVMFFFSENDTPSFWTWGRFCPSDSPSYSSIQTCHRRQDGL